MPGFSSWGVFLSYRREDAAAYARLLQEQLSKSLPEARVFMDLDSIEAGPDFAEVIGEALDSCAVFVALIGPQWVTLTDDKGRPRLYNPDDWVRLEVQTALERGVRVIPVLVDGARPLREELLPAELHELARLNALELSYSRYQYDADRLVELIQRVLAAAPGTGTGTMPDLTRTPLARCPIPPRSARHCHRWRGAGETTSVTRYRYSRTGQQSPQSRLMPAATPCRKGREPSRDERSHTQPAARADRQCRENSRCRRTAI